MLNGIELQNSGNVKVHSLVEFMSMLKSKGQLITSIQPVKRSEPNGYLGCNVFYTQGDVSFVSFIMFSKKESVNVVEGQQLPTSMRVAEYEDKSGETRYKFTSRSQEGALTPEMFA